MYYSVYSTKDFWALYNESSKMVEFVDTYKFSELNRNEQVAYREQQGIDRYLDDYSIDKKLKLELDTVVAVTNEKWFTLVDKYFVSKYSERSKPIPYETLLNDCRQFFNNYILDYVKRERKLLEEYPVLDPYRAEKTRLAARFNMLLEFINKNHDNVKVIFRQTAFLSKWIRSQEPITQMFEDDFLQFSPMEKDFIQKYYRLTNSLSAREMFVLTINPSKLWGNRMAKLLICMVGYEEDADEAQAVKDMHQLCLENKPSTICLMNPGEKLWRSEDDRIGSGISEEYESAIRSFFFIKPETFQRKEDLVRLFRAMSVVYNIKPYSIETLSNVLEEALKIK